MRQGAIALAGTAEKEWLYPSPKKSASPAGRGKKAGLPTNGEVFCDFILTEGRVCLYGGQANRHVSRDGERHGNKLDAQKCWCRAGAPKRNSGGRGACDRVLRRGRRNAVLRARTGVVEVNRKHQTVIRCSERASLGPRWQSEQQNKNVGKVGVGMGRK